MSIKVGDYVVSTKVIKGIVEQSVGLVKGVSGEEITVFFVGANATIKTDKNHVDYLDVKKTGKPLRAGTPYGKKICNICHQLKDNKEFEINQTDTIGRKTTRPSCRSCRVAINGKPTTPEEDRRLKSIRPKDIFTCPICGKTSIVDVTVTVRKDHDHKTGEGRAWICDSCNTGLGRFRDDPKLLQKAIEYLKKKHS